MKTYDYSYIYWLKHHAPTTREEYMVITSHASQFPPVFPRTLYIEIGWDCNLSCTFCSKPTRRKNDKEMTIETIKRIIKECAENGTWYISFHDYNEPLLFLPKLLPAIRYAKECGIPTVATTTNMTPLTMQVMEQLIDAGLDSLHLSFEGADPQLYEQVRGVKYKPMVARIMNAVEVRKRVGATDKLGRLRPWLAISMVRTVETDEQCAAFIQEWGDIADDVECRPMLEYLGRTEFKGAHVPPQRVPCRYLADRLVVQADGGVTACSVDVDGDLQLGNVCDGTTISEIWNSKKYRDLWALHAWEKWGELPEPCRSCGSWDFLSAGRSQHLKQTLR